jgi:hypothetical protein
MTNEEMIKVIEQDLSKLKTELEAYKDENKLWITDGDIKNSAGNLALHLVGNLKHFIGAVLGNSGYVRNRDAEFSSKNIPVKNITKEIDEALDIVKKTILSFTEEDYAKEYPEQIFNFPMTTGYFIIRLTEHLGYHLGQINYHRRLLDK